jgi:eukaryotic-like serine/threonine-protein kinase
MALAPGTRLGPYEVIAPLGAGGMGEVYRALDRRLDRTVAIKILSPQFADDPARRERFEREAKAVAALSHPNILAIHDVGSDALTPGSPVIYAVTELLGGETLRKRLATDPPPARKAVEIAVQIAGGLAAAHEKGIVHRDLKPENVFITTDGRVKILDFGLATQATPAVHWAPEAPTVALATDPGTVLGTVGYMSPEQVRGERVDHRSDIFSLGAVLYEMLTGRRAFARDTAAETMTAILKEDVADLSSSGRQMPVALERIVRRCLEKRPEERLQAARDVAITLEAVSGTDVSSPVPVAAPPLRRWRAVALIVLGLAAAAAGGYAIARLGERPVDPSSISYTRLTYRRGFVTDARFAPDAQSIVYSAVWDDEPLRIYPVRIDQPRADSARLVEGGLLAVSRTGDIGVVIRPAHEGVFIRRGTLGQMPLGGGAPREIVDAVEAADFAPDGRMAVVRSAAGRTRLEFPRGKVLYETTGWISSPRVSAAGDRIAFNEHPLPDEDRGWPALVDLATGAKRDLADELDQITGLVWAPGGDEVCFGSLTSIQCARVSTRSVRVLLRSTTWITPRDIAPDGRMLGVAWDLRVAQIAGDVNGREIDLSWQETAVPFDLTRDGSRLLFLSADYGLYVRGVDGSPPVRLGTGIPVGFSPDGRSLLSIQLGVPTSLTVVPTGAGEPRVLPRDRLESHNGAAWLPDGRHVVISAAEPGRGSRLYVQDVQGGSPKPISGEGVRLSNTRGVAPDGRTVIAIGPDRAYALYPVDGGTPQPMTGLGTDLVPVGWTDRPNVVFARPIAYSRLMPIYRVDLTTGRRDIWKTLGPADRRGSPTAMLALVSPDGGRYVYAVAAVQSDLFLITGLFGEPDRAR